MCRAANEPGGPRRCPDHRVRSKADNAARKQVSRYKQQVAQVEADRPDLQRVIKAQMTTTDPTDSGVIARLRTDRSRARRTGDAAAVELVNAQLAAAQLVLAEHRVAQARRETTTCPNTAPENAPKPTPTPAAAAKDVRAERPAAPARTGASKETTPLVTPAQIEDVYDRVLLNRPAEWNSTYVTLTELRAAMPDVPRKEFDQAVIDLAISDTSNITFIPEVNQKALTPEDRAAAIHIGGEDKLLLQIRRPDAKRAAERDKQRRSGQQQPAATTAPRAKAESTASGVTLESRIRSVYAELATKPQDWVRLSKLREKLGNPDKAEMEQILRTMIRTGMVHLAPDSNRKALTDADHAAAVRFGSENKHLIAIEPDSDLT